MTQSIDKAAKAVVMAMISEMQRRGGVDGHIKFAGAETRDRRDGTQEHFICFEISTTLRTKAMAQSCTLVIENCLHEAKLAVPGYILLGLRYIFSTVRRELGRSSYIASVYFRAATEVITNHQQVR